MEEMSCAYKIVVKRRVCDNLGEVDVGWIMYLNGSLRDLGHEVFDKVQVSEDWVHC
jgi:hypothetical protein